MSLVDLHKNLLQQWGNEGSRNLANVEKTISTIKNLLVDSKVISALEGTAILTIHRDVLEIDSLAAALKGDLKAFDDAIAQVMALYSGLNEESPNKYLMIGLNLMFLIACNRLSDFHVLLEQVSQKVQIGNPYISTPVKLEQSLMEGAYNKVILTEKTIPSPYYAAFIRIMMDTVRNDIAACMEKAFKRVPAKDAQQLLLFDKPAELNEFTKKRQWKLDGDAFSFEVEAMQTDGSGPRQQLDTSRIAKQTIFYAKQLEMIV